MRLNISSIEIPLSAMVRMLHEEFQEYLTAVVVYGSFARGTATRGSDIDLLIVARGLLQEWESLHSLENEWTGKGRQLGKRFQIMLASPEDVEDSVEWAAPLMLEIYNTHAIIFDRDSFFANQIIRMEHLVRARGIRMRKPGVWEVPEHAVAS